MNRRFKPSTVTLAACFGFTLGFTLAFAYVPPMVGKTVLVYALVISIANYVYSCTSEL